MQIAIINRATTPITIPTIIKVFLLDEAGADSEEVSVVVAVVLLILLSL
jgi:hypothetical protein